MNFKKFIITACILLLSAAAFAHPYPGRSYRERITRESGIILQAYISAIKAIEQGDTAALEAALYDTQKQLSYPVYQLRLLDCFAAVLRMDERYLEQVKFIPYKLHDFRSQIAVNDIFSDDKSSAKTIEDELFAIITEKAKILLTQYRKNTLSYFWLLYFSGSESEFYSRIWQEGPEKSAVHRSFHQDRKRLEQNPKALFDFFMGGGASLSFYAEPDQFADKQYSAFLTWAGYNMIGTLLDFQYELSADFMTGDFNADIFNDEHPSLLLSLDISISFLIKLLNDRSPVNFAVGPRLNAAYCPGADFGGIGIGACADIRLHLNKLHSTMLKLGTSFNWNNYYKDGGWLFDSFISRTGLSIVFMDGYKSWEKDRKKYYEDFKIPGYKPYETL